MAGWPVCETGTNEDEYEPRLAGGSGNEVGRR
jgi:hypothetical protein